MIRWIGFAGLAALLAGCAFWNREPEPAAGQPQRLIRVDWYGNQCFRIKSALGLSILTNPFAPGTTDFTPPENLQPEILLISNETSDANYVDLVDNTPHILRGALGVGTNTAAGIRILGVPIYRNPEAEEITGMNVVYRWSMDGLKFCFPGNLRDPLTRAQASKIGAVDVLFIPVGNSDFTAAEQAEVIQQLRPRVLIPMGSLGAIHRFASGFTSVYRLKESAALLSREALPAQPTVLVFEAP